MKKSNSSDFLEIMEKHFEFLLRDLNFSIDEPYRDYAELISENCKVVVVARNNQCSVSLRPMGATSDFLKSENLKANSIEVEVILKRFAPQEKFKTSYSIFALEDIEAEVIRNVSLMKAHCVKLLQGDFSEWERLKNKRNVA